MRYVSAGDQWDYCDGATWQAFGGAGTPATPDRGIQFNSGGIFFASSSFVYTSAGLLGIGTATPAALLHFKNGGPGTTGLPRLLLDNTDYVNPNVGSKGDWYLDVGDIGAFRLGLDNSGGNEFQILEDGTVEIGPGATTYFHFSSAGNLGIGTSAPADDVHINGQQSAILDADGLHVRDDITFGGTVKDVGTPGFDARAAESPGGSHAQ